MQFPHLRTHFYGALRAVRMADENIGAPVWTHAGAAKHFQIRYSSARFTIVRTPKPVAPRASQGSSLVVRAG